MGFKRGWEMLGGWGLEEYEGFWGLELGGLECSYFWLRVWG